MRTKSKAKQLRSLLAAEKAARNLQQRLWEVKARWEALRTPEFLASEEYKNYCKETGVSEEYNFGDVIC